MVTAIALGLLIGTSLGLLGGGGSILTVPIFVYVLGFPPKEAIAMSLAVVGATSLAGILAHWRAGRVNLRLGLLFGGGAMLGTVAGTSLARLLPGGLQLGLFGVVMAIAAVFMMRAGADDDVRPVHLSRHTVLPVTIAAAAVGLLTGVVGVGGGFLIVPALVLAALPMRQAVGTSLLVITMNCAIGLYGYVGQVSIDWPSVGLVTAGTLPGLALGTHVHGLVPQQALRRGFAAFLVLIAAFMLYQNVATVLAAFSPR